MQTAGYTREQEAQIRLEQNQKASKRSCTVLGKNHITVDVTADRQQDTLK